MTKLKQSFFFYFMLLLLCESLEISKASSSETKENKLHGSKENIHKSRKHLGTKHANHPKNRRVSIQRCFVICPIDVASFSFYNDFPEVNIPVPVNTFGSTHTTKQPVSISNITDETDDDDTTEKTTSANFTATSTIHSNRKPKHRYGHYSHKELDFNHPSLNNVLRTKLLMELKSFNKHVKPAYKFGPFLPNDCFVACKSLSEALPPGIFRPGIVPPGIDILGISRPTTTDQPDIGKPSTKKPVKVNPETEKPGNATAAPQKSTTESDNDDDEKYQEGEDTPEEITKSPPSNSEDQKAVHIQ